MTRTAGAQIGCQRPSRFWGLGCPKIYHEAEDTLGVLLFPVLNIFRGDGFIHPSLGDSYREYSVHPPARQVLVQDHFQYFFVFLFWAVCLIPLNQINKAGFACPWGV
ncbi:hypothetical protein [Thiolapillus sp.]|uniref:hypothetical protein n=2 Tax=Thiolapillus sp. TaxID=2017437 RepID=UPI002601113B|nr:hypothetical protein [Thiolapillus sp.]